jgi:hypothetical protein
MGIVCRSSKLGTAVVVPEPSTSQVAVRYVHPPTYPTGFDRPLTDLTRGSTRGFASPISTAHISRRVEAQEGNQCR